MRAAEFIPEKINTAITEPSFRDKKRIGKFLYTAEYYRPHRPSQSDWIKVSCKYYFKTVGWAIFKVIGIGDDAHLVSQDTEVVPKYRKQGIATAMYEYARSLGNDIMPSPGQLPDGEAMWAAWRKSGKVSQLDELNWRAPAAAAGIAGAIGGGLATHNSQPTEPVAQVAPAEKSAPEIKAPVAQAAPTKNINDDLIAHAEALLKKPNARILYQTAVAAGLQDTELAQFLAQCAHETKNFTTRREDGSKEYFMKKYDKKYNPQNAAILGNVNPGDGARYFGRGDIQLTGRDNYARVGRALGLDLVNRPELAENPEIAAKIAVHFWQNRVVPRVDNFADTAAVTRPINRRLTGLDDRDEKFKGLHHVLVANK